MNYQQLAQDTVHAAIRVGADEAEVFLQTGEDFDVDVRMGEVETLTQAGAKGLGLRVFVDKRMAFVSTTDFEPRVIDELITDAVRLAKTAGRDRFNGLPDVGPGNLPHLDLYDPKVISVSADKKIEMARETDRAAFDYDLRITNSRGAGFASHYGTRILANSNGLLYENSYTECGISCAPVAEENGEKQIGHYWSSTRFFDRLETPSEIGRIAAMESIRKLGARKVETQKVPVVFSWMVGPTLLSAIFSALDGESVHRGISFLKNMQGKQIASENVTVIDDPLMPAGLGSMPFDGEGVLTRTKTVIDKGILQLYFYDARTARKYGEQPTGNARRGYSGTPSVGPMNFYLKPADLDPSEIILGIDNGFYVTDTIGRGANTVTGDFSVGASGMWIKDGELAFPVQEVTIAGNMLDMMKNIEQVANDAKFISSIVSPTFKISEMTISGK